ncbi:MAG: hypothetical protein AB7N54_12995 [Alphaproteobacteria bacterium]
MSAMRTRRLVMAIDPRLASPSPLDEAARLARGLEAELTALLVEDSGASAVAGLSVGRFVGYTGMAMSAPDASALRRAHRVHERRVRERLAAAGSRWSVSWSLESVTDFAPADVAQRAGRGDLVVLASPGRGRPAGASALALATSLAGPVLLINTAVRSDSGVLVVFTGRLAELDTAARFARCLGAPLAVLAAGKAERARIARAQRAVQWLAARGLAARVEMAGGATIESWLDAVTRTRPGLVVLRRDAAGLDGPAADALAATASLLLAD